MKESVFERMKRWGEGEGWNQTEIASRLGLLPQNVSNWKKRGVPPEWHAPIARLFGRSIDELLGGEPESSGNEFEHALPEDERQLLAAYRALGKKEKKYLLADAEKYLSDKKPT